MTRHKSNWHWFFGPLGVLIVLLAVGDVTAREWLRYDRALLAGPEPWRALSAHLVHLSWSHAMLNAIGLVLVGLLFQSRATVAQWWLCLFTSVLAIDVGLFFGSPSLSWYVGASGALHGLFVLGAWREWEDGQRSGLVLLLAAASKLIYEQVVGALPMTASASGGPVVVEAHLYGALGGALAYGLMRASAGRHGPNDE